LGQVTRVSADITPEQQRNSGQPVQASYSVRVALLAGEVARLNNIRLLLRMPAEVCPDA
jgi:hypothetical protein